MTRGSIPIPAEARPSELELMLARKSDLGKRYGELNDQIVAEKMAFRSERIRIQAFLGRARRKAAFIALSQTLDQKLQLIYQSKGRLRVELADLALKIKNKEVQRQEENRARGQLRQERHQQHLEHVRLLMELPEEDVRALTARALVAFRRLKYERLLLPDECKLIPLLDDFVRKSQLSDPAAH